MRRRLYSGTCTTNSLDKIMIQTNFGKTGIESELFTLFDRHQRHIKN